MASSDTATLPCPDWVLSNNSNVHVARDRSWLTTYTPFQTYIGNHSGSPAADAIGIGDVELPVKLFPRLSGKRAHGTLRLQNVLHVPGAMCNIVGGPSRKDYIGMRIGGVGESGRDAEITDGDGRRLGYFTDATLWVLRLSGPPVGPVVGKSSLVKGGMYMIHAFWSESERQRWAAAQSASSSHQTDRAETHQQLAVPQKREAQDSGAPPYTKEEKDWLERSWGGEFKFLMSHALNIHEDPDEWSDDDDDDGDALEQSFQGHFADYNFTHEELDFIENGWGNSESFMLSFGLKFYKDEDCEEAKAIVRALMSEEDSDSESEEPGAPRGQAPVFVGLMPKLR